MGRKIKHNYDKVCQEHKNGKSLKNISKELNIPLPSIYDYFRRNKIEYNKEIPTRHSGYKVEDTYLDDIDTERKAYFLGWMFSDGYINKNRVFLKLQIRDGYIIKEMFEDFCGGYKILNTKTSSAMTISSTKIVEALIKLGCVQNKTIKGFNLPDLNNNIINHFIRGYFDGDGCISKRSARPKQVQISICSIDKLFLEQLKNKLLEFTIISTINEEVRFGKLLKRPGGKMSTNNKNMFRLVITSHQERLKFYEFLYKDCSIKLKRKYDFYSEYYVNTVLNIENKKSISV